MTPAAITNEARLDGIYVLRTSLPKDRLAAADTVRAYKSLAQVERAFRSLKTVCRSAARTAGQAGHRASARSGDGKPFAGCGPRPWPGHRQGGL